MQIAKEFFTALWWTCDPCSSAHIFLHTSCPRRFTSCLLPTYRQENIFLRI